MLQFKLNFNNYLIILLKLHLIKIHKLFNLFI